MPPNALRLGWNNPPGIGYTGPDGPKLTRQFADISRFMSAPHVFLQHDNGALALGGTLVSIPWGVEISDPYSLHDTNGTTIRVPPGFDTWMAVGQTSVSTDGAGGAGRRFIGWRVNGALVRAHNSAHFVGGGGTAAPYVSAGIMLPVSIGQTIDVVASNGGAAADGDVDLQLVLTFFPMS